MIAFKKIFHPFGTADPVKIGSVLVVLMNALALNVKRFG